jgi:hypothetical protein
MILSTFPELGKSETLANLADDLSSFVRRSARTGSSLDEAERGVLDRVLILGRTALDLFLKAQGDGDLGETVTTKEDKILYRSESVMPRKLRTIFGKHTFQSFVYSRGFKEKIELRPIDARVNLPEGTASYLLQEFTQYFCIEKAFAVAADQFETVFKQKISVDVLEGINRDMGAQADPFLDRLSTPPAAKEGKFLIATADGKGVPLVTADAETVPVFDKKERPGNRRMATLGCVYTVDPYIRTPEQIVAALFRDRTVAQPDEDRPEARFKHYRSYFASAEPGEEPIPSAYSTWAWMGQELSKRHQPGQMVIRLMDGQPSLWDAADACLGDFKVTLGETQDQFHFIDILDILHVSGYVWRAAKVFHSHKEGQEAFAQGRLLRILQGDVRGVVKGLRRMSTLNGLGGKAAKELATVCNYLEKNAERMNYHQYLQAGFPIASGVIEGACRHLIKDRMEHAGMRWTLEGAGAMLNVRSVKASSEWDEFGSWRQLEEAKRVHPHRGLVADYQGFAA